MLILSLSLYVLLEQFLCSARLGPVVQLASELTGFLTEQLQVYCAVVSRFDTGAIKTFVSRKYEINNFGILHAFHIENLASCLAFVYILFSAQYFPS